ncbi:MAG TPA: hypothetical protein VGM05_09375 [Planctomycetaceae bacterium]|jgi:hypothetical protein
MKLLIRRTASAALAVTLLAVCRFAQADVPVDLTAYEPASGVAVDHQGSRLHIRWQMAEREYGSLTLELQPNQPLIAELGISQAADGAVIPLVRDAQPVTLLTVGVRDLAAQGWNVFFDNPPSRPHETFLARLEKRKVRVQSHGLRSTVVIDALSAGPFQGQLQFTFYAGCRLVHAEAVLMTAKHACAILYDAGLVGGAASSPGKFQTIAWLDANDQWHRTPADGDRPAEPVAVRHRTLIAENEAGSLAIFPPPHQFLYPLDFADNFKFVWHGSGHHDLLREWGFGVRQPADGDKRFVPWVNAPPGTDQHLGVFYLLSLGRAEDALAKVRRFTHGDRFPKLPGYKTFTSHYHVEHTLDYLRRQKEQRTDGVPAGLETPGFVTTFQARGVDIAHLAEFHVGHTPEMVENRIPSLELLHNECRRLSNADFLLLPGEEPNVHLGGHWISLFPKPVYWLLHPQPDTPFVQEVPGIGKVYAVHSAEEVQRLMEQEQGLMWTAHPRTKSSYGFPDHYRQREFYRSERFLGAAWKALPADLSQPRLGSRALDLLSDMANWGTPKYMLGEVDVFRVEPQHELYGHMNINYLKLEKLPRFDDGWQPVLEALRQGRFFVTTGEVLLTDFAVGGCESGQTLTRGDKTIVDVTAQISWTFPPAFAEVVWGDGRQIFRKQLDLADAGAFDRRSLRIPVDVAGAKWVRLEVWDVAANGAFTQPVWIQ